VSRGKEPADVGDTPVQRVENRLLECDTQIPPSRRPLAWEDEQCANEYSYFIFHLVKPVEPLLSLVHNRNPSRQSGDSVSAGDQSLSPGSY